MSRQIPMPLMPLSHVLMFIAALYCDGQPPLRHAAAAAVTLRHTYRLAAAVAWLMPPLLTC